jgi:predicted  nucleic acid-binding Zn-ribbon protein
MPLPKIDDVMNMKDTSSKINSILPSNEYCQLNPNLHVANEEIQKLVEDKLSKIMKKRKKESRNKEKA